jgi:signal transduction histidine kinase/CHASE2 domain-containing sensor protein
VKRFALSFVLLVLVLLLSLIPVVRDSEVRLTDTFFRLSARPAQPSVVLLAMIDEDSLRQYGRWPWSRELLSELTNNLTQAGAGAIGLDILMSEPQSPEADASLAKSLRASGRVVIAGKIGDFPGGPHWVSPLPELTRAAVAVGHVHALLDADSICRRFPPRELTIDGPRLAFAVEVARQIDPHGTSAFLASYGVAASDDKFNISRAAPVLVRIPFRRDRFETVSASSVLKGGNLGARFSGRPILVGFGATEIGDRLNTPLSAEMPAPGIEVHAQILDAILTRRSLRELSTLSSTVVLAFTCLMVVSTFGKWHSWTSVGLLVGLAIAVYGTAFLTFSWVSRIQPVGAMLLAVILGPLVVFTADFVAVERSLTQQLIGLRSWLTTQGKERGLPSKGELSWKLELLQKLETELGSLYELHKSLLESTRDSIAIYDDKGNLLLNNRRFALAIPSSAANLDQLGKQWIPNDDAPLTDLAPGQEGEVYLRNALYSVRIVPLPPTRLSPGGGIIVTLSNLQTRVERDRARAEALAFITHELRTPLASIQGFADLMINYPGSADCEGAAETISWESKRLLALINSYLDVLRLDAGAKPVKADFLELHDIVRQVFEILRPLAAAVNMRLILETDLTVMTLGDANLINGAVLNLVSNAIKYGKPGTDIRVRCSIRERDVVIAVQNESSPIAAEDIPHLFEPYYRGKDVDNRKPGWGLGLAFVKRVAEKHGGAVTVQNESNGMTFEIHLPAKTEIEAPAEIRV